MHAQSLAFYEANLAGLGPLDVVEFGSCDMNGTVRSVYPQAKSWHGVDLQPGPHVDEVADAATWVSARKFGICVCAEVFEHTPVWRGILSSARLALLDGGLLVATCATGHRHPHSAVDGGPLRAGEFYENVDPDDMRYELDRQGWSFSTVQVTDGYFGGDDLQVWAIR